MADRFKVVFPARGRQYLDGGLNNKYERSIIAENESPSCANVRFSNGAVATRGGITKLNTTTIGTYAGDGIYTRRANDTTETMIVWANGTAYALTGTSTFTTIGSAQSVFTAGVRVAAMQYENHIFFGNGAKAYKYNGTDFTRHGVPVATGSVTIASGTTATGVLNGAQSYKFTYVNTALAEGDVSTAWTGPVLVNGYNNISGIPTAPQSHGVYARRLYRYDGTSYKRVGTISDNTTTTYQDNVATSALGVAAPTDNGEPPNYNACIYHQNRLFVNDPNNPNYVWYSELGEPYTFPTTNFFLVGDASSDLVKGFAVFDDALFVMCENSIWVNYMQDTDDTNWKQVRVRSAYGTKSPFGIVNYQNKVLFPATQNSKFVGFASITGNAVDTSATLLTLSAAGSDLQSDRIETDMYNINVNSLLGRISAIVFKSRIYCAVPYGSGATENNRVYVLDIGISNLNRKQPIAWSPDTGIYPEQYTIYNGKLYFISSRATGYVYEAETSTYSDDGSAIDSYVWTKEFTGQPGHETWDKDFRTVEPLVDQAGVYYMDVYYRTDSDAGEGTSQQVNLDPDSNTWGTLRFGSDVWGGGQDQDEKILYLSGARGRRIQFKFTNQNTAGQRFKVHGLTFSYNLKGKR